ncbi:MAG: hypothetical protein QXL01_07135 [Thermoplasmatales archaeon]
MAVDRFAFSAFTTLPRLSVIMFDAGTFVFANISTMYWGFNALDFHEYI